VMSVEHLTLHCNNNKMSIKCLYLALAVACLLFAQPFCLALDTRQIDSVRSKGVLSQQDLQVIDSFIAEGIQELLVARRFSDIARLRTLILSRQSSQKQYAQQFSESAYRHLTEGLRQALRLPGDLRIKVTINLLILIDGLQDLRLTDLSVAMLKSTSPVIRYWAVHSLTNPGIVKKLNAAGSERARLIAEKLNELVGRETPETIRLIAEFAASVNIPQGQALLLRIADERIKQYAAWTVKYELLDGIILKLLSGKILSGGANQSAFAYRFAQLYSCAIQRYVNGKALLTDTQKRHLASVLVGTEESCIGKLLGAPQSSIKRAVERGDYSLLKAEHDKLLGTGAQPGLLASKIKFVYGPDSSGRKSTGPFALPPPPVPAPGR